MGYANIESIDLCDKFVELLFVGVDLLLEVGGVAESAIAVTDS